MTKASADNYDAFPHDWEVEYLPDPTSGGGVVRSGMLVCRKCGSEKPDA